MQFQQSEATAAQRRFPVYLVDATDGITPEDGESGGQPQVSENGAAFANTSATLTFLANGFYYVELTAAELSTLGMLTIRYKSANTVEFNLTGQVVAFDPYAAYALASIATEARLAELDAGNIPTDLSNIQSDTDDIQTRLPAALSGGRMDSDVGALGGVVQSLTDLKDFADDGYDPATDKVQGVVLVDTTTANSDMRGTENAALASVLGALADVAADGDPTAADTLMQYVKQLVNVLVGTAGVVAYPAAVAPGNGVNLAEVLREIFDDVTGIGGITPSVAGDAMDLVGNAIDAAAIGVGAIEADAFAAGAIDAAAIATDAIDADAIAANAIGASEIAAGAITSSEAPNLDAAISSRAVAGDAMALTAGAVDDIWNEDATGHQGAGTFGETIGDSAATGVTIHARVNQALPAVAPAANGGLPTVDAANMIVGIQGAKNDFDDLVDLAQADILNDATPFPGASVTEVRLAELDAANLPTDVANVQSDTDNIQTRLPAALVGGAMDADISNIQANAIDSGALDISAGQEIADRVLARSIQGGADGGRIVRDALRAIRNRRAVVAGTLTVYEEDDVTPAWTGVVTTAAGNPITEIDPA